MTHEVKLKSAKLKRKVRIITNITIIMITIITNITTITNTTSMITSPPSLSSLALATSSRPEVNSAVTLISFWYSVRRR